MRAFLNRVLPRLVHFHEWDICRQYGQYRYKRCLYETCTAKQPC